MMHGQKNIKLINGMFGDLIYKAGVNEKCQNE